MALGIWGPAFAWRITKELQWELQQKQAEANRHPKDPAILFDLAITQAYTNNIIDGMMNIKKIANIDINYKKRALKDYVSLVNETPNDWKLRFRMAFVYYSNNYKKEAIEEFANVLKIDPYNVWAYGYMALIYGEMDEVDKAMELTKKGLAIDNNVAALHLLLGEGYYKKGDSWGGLMERLEALRLKALGY
ncbi:hypothetical protein HZB07_06875 [Candidatus Saganbacteria bacterium]|nr:hypothetical protein [Candidatus Saganbacteria bacterium]